MYTKDQVEPLLPPRIAKRIAFGGPDECWVWTGGSLNSSGYPMARYGGPMRLVHRVVHELVKGCPGEACRHSCDRPGCCNPNHLLAGTQLENIEDRHLKARDHLPKGEGHPRARLKEADIPVIRADPRTLGAIAADYGVSFATIFDVKHYRSWKHVPGP